MDEPLLLRALGWDHPRCRLPMEACAAAYSAARVAWEYRSLESFGDQPLAELAHQYDLVVIDHPHIGEAVEAGCLRPLAASDPGVKPAADGVMLPPDSAVIMADAMPS